MNLKRFFTSSFINIQLFGIINSYSQIFLSKNKLYAFIILLSSFVDYNIGLCGIISIIISNLISYFLNYDNFIIKEGIYGFNSLLVGLTLGAYFDFNVALLAIIFFSSLLTLLLTIWLLQNFTFSQLPILSIPFLLGAWIVILATREFGALELSVRGIYTASEITALGGSALLRVYENALNIPLPLSLEVYFRSLASIIFQHDIISGILIALGLLIASRIAFTLSFIGFFSGWFFFNILESEQILNISYSFFGFNFILTAIAIGGIFFIPDFWSYFAVIVITPVNAILIICSIHIFEPYQLPILSLPFNIIVLLLIVALRSRTIVRLISPVPIQHFSPEKNLYTHQIRQFRFGKKPAVLLSLPFYGEWAVTQGHNGAITHKDKWNHAWDFSIKDRENRTYQGSGSEKEDYYCYKLPIIAPADGWVIEIVNHVEDNPIGTVNLHENWGNLVIIKHAEGLYSKLCHLHKDIKVQKNAYIHKGELIGYCGNSGRSPEPHLHFQLQSTPYVGSGTLPYPLGYYLVRKEKEFEFHANDIPNKDEYVSNLQVSDLLKNAFAFVLGQQMTFKIFKNNNETLNTWEVRVDMYNNPYIYCFETGSVAYFINDGQMFYFVSFYGKQESLLYYFYLASHQIALGFYPRMVLKDELNVTDMGIRILGALQDFISPFYQIQRNTIETIYEETDNLEYPSRILIKSRVSCNYLNYSYQNHNLLIEVKDNLIFNITVIKDNQEKIWAEQINY